MVKKEGAVHQICSQKVFQGKRGGFTLLELVIVTLVIVVLGAVGMSYYRTAVEKSYGAEVYPIFAQVRSGWMTLKEEGFPTGWNPNVGAASDSDWRLLNMDNPNANPQAYFAYDVWDSGFSSGSGMLPGGPAARNIVIAFRRTALGAYSASTDMNKWIYMDLDSGEIFKSQHY